MDATKPKTLPTDSEILDLASVAELKDELQIRHALLDALLQRKLLDAYRWMDCQYLNRPILTQTWYWYPDQFIDGMEVPWPDVQSITAIQYQDVDDVTQTLATSVYEIDDRRDFSKLYTKTGQSWPAIYANRKPITIEFVCGIGDAAAVKAKAAGIRTATLLLAAHLYRNREATYAEPRLVQVPRELMYGMDAFAGQYRYYNRAV